MNNYKVKINLSKMSGTYPTVVNTPTGSKLCVVIPIEENNIFISQKGSIYLSLVAQKMKTIKYEQTHQIKNSIPYEKYKDMTQKQRERIPIIGSMQPVEYANNTQEKVTHRIEQQSIQDNSFDSLPF